MTFLARRRIERRAARLSTAVPPVRTDYGERELSGALCIYDRGPYSSGRVVGDIYRHRDDRILITFYVTAGKNKKLGARSSRAVRCRRRAFGVYADNDTKN